MKYGQPLNVRKSERGGNLVKDNIIEKRHKELQEAAIDGLHSMATGMYHSGLTAAFGTVLYLIDEGIDSEGIKEYIIDFLKQDHMLDVKRDAYQFWGECASDDDKEDMREGLKQCSY